MAVYKWDSFLRKILLWNCFDYFCFTPSGVNLPLLGNLFLSCTCIYEYSINNEWLFNVFLEFGKQSFDCVENV